MVVIKLYNTLMLVAALVAMIAGVWTVALQIRSKRAEVTAEITSMEELTPPTRLPDLSATFTYKGQPVDHLWKVTLNIVNSGDKTLVGEGTQKILMGDNISFEFPADCRLLDTIVVRKDFPGALHQSQNSIAISFTQWRKLESFSVSCFVTRPPGARGSIHPPIPTAQGRSIIDGDILIRDISTPVKNAKKPLLDYLPAPLAIPAKAVGAISIAVWGGLLVGFGFFLFRDLVRTKWWKRKHLAEFQTFLATQQIEPLVQRSYLNNPTLVPKNLWTAYPGKKLRVFFPQTDLASPSASVVLAIILIGIGSTTLLLAVSAYAKF